VLVCFTQFKQCTVRTLSSFNVTLTFALFSDSWWGNRQVADVRMYTFPTAWQVCTSNKRVVGMGLFASADTEYWSCQVASGYFGEARTLRNSTLLLTTSTACRSYSLLFSSTLKDLTLFSWCGNDESPVRTLCYCQNVRFRISKPARVIGNSTKK
jgi:hypothetical protein